MQDQLNQLLWMDMLAAHLQAIATPSAAHVNFAGQSDQEIAANALHMLEERRAFVQSEVDSFEASAPEEELVVDPHLVLTVYDVDRREAA